MNANRPVNVNGGSTAHSIGGGVNVNGSPHAAGALSARLLSQDFNRRTAQEYLELPRVRPSYLLLRTASPARAPMHVPRVAVHTAATRHMPQGELDTIWRREVGADTIWRREVGSSERGRGGTGDAGGALMLAGAGQARATGNAGKLATIGSEGEPGQVSAPVELVLTSVVSLARTDGGAVVRRVVV